MQTDSRGEAFSSSKGAGYTMNTNFQKTGNTDDFIHKHHMAMQEYTNILEEDEQIDDGSSQELARGSDDGSAPIISSEIIDQNGYSTRHRDS